MPFQRFSCQRNAFLEELHKTYKVTPLAVPDTKTQPLMAVAHRGNKTQLLGPLADLLQNKSALDGLEVYTNPSIDLQSNKTGNFNASFGLGLLKGFWQKVAPDLESAQLEASLKQSIELSLSFDQVQQRYIFANSLGRILNDCPLLPKDHSNMELFARPVRPMELFVIESVFECNKFNLHLEKQGEGTAKLDAAALAAALKGSANLHLKAQGSSTLSFESDQFLTFGFSCIHLPFDLATGKIKIGETTIWSRGRTGGGGSQSAGLAAVSLMSLDGLGVLEWDLIKNKTM